MSYLNIAPLMRAEDVAKAIAMPVNTLKKNVSANRTSVPPFLKLGGYPNSPVRWRKADVEQWLQERFDACNSSDKGDENVT